MEDQLSHALSWLPAIDPTVDQALDLGSGGGLPGLVLAAALPNSRWTLVDRQVRRCRFLTEQVRRLGLADRVQVLNAAGEDAGRTPEHRGRYRLVTARSFGPPALTAELAAPFLLVSGTLVVADPPDAAGRWDTSGLRRLGLVLQSPPDTAVSLAVMRQAEICPDAYPRSSAAARRHPLF